MASDVSIDSINRLPDELIDSIPHFLYNEWVRDTDPRHEVPTSIMNLCKVSRRLHRIATPHLYRTFILGGGAGYGTRTPSARPLWCFARTIFRHHDLASLVKTFSCNLDVDLWDDDPQASAIDCTRFRVLDESEKSDASLRRLFLSRAEASSPDEPPDYWFRHIWDIQFADAITALLLPYLPNLQRLQLKHRSSLQWDAPFLAELVKKVHQRRRPFDTWEVFQHLQGVMVSGTDNACLTRPDLFGICRLLPTLRRLYGYHLGIIGVDSFNLEDPSIDGDFCPAGNVEEIELRMCHINAADLRLIVQACKKLKTFMYVAGPDYSTPLKTSFMQPILERRARSLQRLCLDMMGMLYVYKIDSDWDVRPMSFSKFTSLRVLKIAPVYLWGLEAWKDKDIGAESLARARSKFVCTLPKSLELLHISYHAFGWWIPGTVQKLEAALEGFLDHCYPQKDKFPRLEKIMIQTGEPDHLEAKFSDTIDRARLVGIELVILHRGKDLHEFEPNWGWERKEKWPDHCVLNNQIPAWCR